MENFLNNPANHKTLRAKAWSRRVLGLWMAPSNEEITNVIWLSKYGIMDTEVIRSLAARVRDNLTTPDVSQNVELIRCAANLLHRGLMGKMESIWLGDPWNTGDLSTVPTEHLVSLVSSVKDTVTIENVNSWDLVPIFDSLNCEELKISHQRLGGLWVNSSNI